jgi:hypothetical protein
MAQLEEARQWHDIELIEDEFKDKTQNKVEEIKVTEIVIENNEVDKIEKSTVEKTIADYSDNELKEIIANNDGRKKIVKEAKKELEKRN